MDNHWIDYLTPEEQRQVDELDVAILRNKDDLTALRARHRRFLELGTSRKRRQAVTK